MERKVNLNEKQFNINQSWSWKALKKKIKNQVIIWLEKKLQFARVKDKLRLLNSTKHSFFFLLCSVHEKAQSHKQNKQSLTS